MPANKWHCYDLGLDSAVGDGSGEGKIERRGESASTEVSANLPMWNSRVGHILLLTHVVLTDTIWRWQIL